MDIDEDDALLVKALEEHEQRALGYHDYKYDTFHMSFKTPPNSCFVYAPLMGIFSHMGFRNFILELQFREKQDIKYRQLKFLDHVAKLVHVLLSDHREDMDRACDEFFQILPQESEVMQSRNASDFLDAFFRRMERQLLKLQRSGYYMSKFKSLFGILVDTKLLCTEERHYTGQESMMMKLRLDIEWGSTVIESLKKYFRLGPTETSEGDLFCSTCNKKTPGQRQRIISKAPSTLILELHRDDKRKKVGLHGGIRWMLISSL